MATPALIITDDLMTSDTIEHWAARDSFDFDWWWVTWMPHMRVCDRNQAITAMTLAEFEAQMRADGGHHLDHPLWPHFCNLAAELAMSGLDALGLLSTPLQRTPEGARLNSAGQVKNQATGRWEYVAEGTAMAKARQRNNLAV